MNSPANIRIPAPRSTISIPFWNTPSRYDSGTLDSNSPPNSLTHNTLSIPFDSLREYKIESAMRSLFCFISICYR
nr:MAG TPA: hypothetical protein [Caudoviricetes sp.]